MNPNQDQSANSQTLIHDEQGIFHALIQDHQTVRQLFQQLSGTADVEEHRKICMELAHELLLHARIEDRVFYSNLEQDMSEQIQEARQEHAEVEQLLEQIRQLDVNDEEWTGMVRELEQSTLHHLDEEESRMFPMAAERLDSERSQALAQEFMSQKLKTLDTISAEQGMGAEQGDEGEGSSEMTRKELYEKAKEMDIQGRSQMTKEELAKAVEGQE